MLNLRNLTCPLCLNNTCGEKTTLKIFLPNTTYCIGIFISKNCRSLKKIFFIKVYLFESKEDIVRTYD